MCAVYWHTTQALHTPVVYMALLPLLPLRSAGAVLYRDPTLTPGGCTWHQTTVSAVSCAGGSTVSSISKHHPAVCSPLHCYMQKQLCQFFCVPSHDYWTLKADAVMTVEINATLSTDNDIMLFKDSQFIEQQSVTGNTIVNLFHCIVNNV